MSHFNPPKSDHSGGRASVGASGTLPQPYASTDGAERIRIALGKGGRMDPVLLAKTEFLLDGASYFVDKKDLYLQIKTKISNRLSVDVSDVRICGSAYWGKRYTDERPFKPGASDLDVALINPQAFCRCMAEVRDVSKNFSDQTVFPAARGRISTFELFRDYAFGKGIIRVDHLPDVKTRRDLVFAA